MSEYHTILGIPASASEAQIKNAYRTLARKYHPDISSDPDAEAKFIEITEAYDALLSPTPVNNNWYEEAPSAEELRRDRARRYAQMQYEKFKANNEAFHMSWYFLPAKIGTYFIVYFFYLLSIIMFLSPVIALFMGQMGAPLVIALFIFALSIRVFMTARQLEKEVRPYFSNFQ
jgi:hypothetical protein